MRTITIIFTGLIALVQGRDGTGKTTKELIALLVNDVHHTAQISFKPPAGGLTTVTGEFDARLLDGNDPAKPGSGSLTIDNSFKMGWFGNKDGSYGKIAPEFLQESFTDRTKVKSRVRVTADSVEYKFNNCSSTWWTPENQAGVAATPPPGIEWPVVLADALQITVTLKDPKLEIRRGKSNRKYALADGAIITISNEPDLDHWKKMCPKGRLSHLEMFYGLSGTRVERGHEWAPATKTQICEGCCTDGTCPVRCPCGLFDPTPLPGWN